jgi:ribosomal protein S12 methylthiotransferase accessory factor
MLFVFWTSCRRLTSIGRDASVNHLSIRLRATSSNRGPIMKTQTLGEILATAAAILTGDAAPEGAPVDLLNRLEYLDGAPEAAAHRAALLRVAAGFRRLFSLPAQDAPGLVALGAEVDAGCLGVTDGPVGGVSGAGLTFRQAFESCVGEGAEYIAGVATQDDGLVSLAPSEALADASPALRSLWARLHPYRRDPQATRGDWVVAANMSDGQPAYLPADLCLRRPEMARDLHPPWPLSTGCGAGTDALGATLHGLMEMIERDAVALWLRGGARGRVVPPGPGGATLGRLRDSVTTRRTWLLDITSDTGVPVVVAVACNSNGFGMCRGSACRPTLAAAADAALMELTQMELGYRLSAAKREVQGESALNDTDRRHIDRFTQLEVASHLLLQPAAPPGPSHDLLSYDRIAILAEIRQRLDAVGVEVYAMNLTRPALGIPVSRTFAPDLEVGLTAPPGRRLLAAAVRSGMDLDQLIVL